MNAPDRNSNTTPALLELLKTAPVELVLAALVPVLFVGIGVFGLQVHHIEPYLTAIFVAVPMLLIVTTLHRAGRLRPSRRWLASGVALSASAGLAAILETRSGYSEIVVAACLALPIAALILPLVGASSEDRRHVNTWRRLARVVIRAPLVQALAIWVATVFSTLVSVYLDADDPFVWVPVAVTSYLSVAFFGLTAVVAPPTAASDASTPRLDRAEAFAAKTLMWICGMISLSVVSLIGVEIADAASPSYGDIAVWLFIASVTGSISLVLSGGLDGEEPDLRGAASRWAASIFGALPFAYIPLALWTAPDILNDFAWNAPPRIALQWASLAAASAYGAGSLLHLGSRLARGRAWLWALPLAHAVGMMVLGIRILLL